MRRSTRICRKPPPNRPNHPSFSLKIGSFVTPSGRATLGVGKSTLREERARRALLFSKTGRLLPIEVLESVLQGCFGCDDHASRFRHQLRIRIQRSDSETRKLRCLLACEYLVTPRDLRDDGLGSLRGCLFVSGRSRHTIFDCDWSSDVCSSDLVDAWAGDAGLAIAVFDLMALGVSVQNIGGDFGPAAGGVHLPRRTRAGFTLNYVDPQGTLRRSEERRVGKEGRSRGSPDH